MEKRESPEPSKSTTVNAPVSAFIGQETIMRKIELLIGQVRGSQYSFPHTLLIGDDGVGKRTLAHHIAHRLGVKITDTNASAIGRAGDLVSILTNLGQGDILLIADLHRMNKIVRECLHSSYSSLENWKIDFSIDETKPITFHLKHFTLIATAPEEAVIDKRLLQQFVCAYKIAPYSKGELRQIFLQELQRLSVTCETGIADAIAEACDGNPGNGVRLIRRAVSHLAKTPTTQLTASEVKEFLQLTLHDVQLATEPTADRRIADDVKREVWRRDKGKCVRCGNRENLEYDHIIPISKGGSNTVRNIELLCESCNRSKGDMI